MGRTPGSKNGISHTPGYTAVGQRAKGQIIDGRYVYNSPSPLERPGTISAFNDKMLMKNSSKHASQAAGKAGEYQERSERAATKAALYGNSSGKPSGAGAQERPAIDYRRDKRFSQVDYSASNKELLKRLAERRKNSLSSNAATINAAIQKSKDRLAENRAALAKQQAQALAKAKLQRIAAKQKVKASDEGGTNDWQRQAAKIQAKAELKTLKRRRKKSKSKSRRGNQNGKKS